MQAAALHFLLVTVAGWLNRRQLAAIDYLREENRVLRAQQVLRAHVALLRSRPTTL